jgi:hypothetical protein
MRVALFSLILAAALSSLHGSELERFWHDFPGFENKLASYGYDRHFAASAQPEFVDGVIRDLKANPSDQRLVEYVCVLYYMDSQIVTSRLRALESSSSTVVAAIRERLTRMTNEKSPPHKP